MSKGANWKLRIRSVAKVPTSAHVYSVYVRQKQDASAQIFSLDYADRMRVYDARGILRSTRKWSSKVRCIAVADIEGEGKDAVVGGVGRKVLVVDHRGRPVWNIKLESDVVACDARDVDGDDAAEVAVALENKRVVLWNDDKEALFSRNMDYAIADVWLEDITNDGELEVVIAEKDGKVTVLTAAGYQLRQVDLGDKLTVFAVLNFGERRLFVTGNHTSTLRVWDIDGEETTQIEISATPRAMATGIPDDVSDIAYLVVSTRDKKLSFWEVQETGRASRTEKVVLQQIGSTKNIMYRRAIKCGNCGASVSPEDPKCPHCGSSLEVIEEYVIEEFIQESIESITMKHNRIKLKKLDRILRRTLPRPAAYNLRKSLQVMIRSGEIEGYLEGNTFVRTEERKKDEMVDKRSINKLASVLEDNLPEERAFEIDQLEQDTNVPRSILRKTLLILLGDGVVEGKLDGELFKLNDRQDSRDFVKKLIRELDAWG